MIGGYALSLGAGLILGGRLGDRFGRRATFLTGVAAFTLASLGCAFAPTIESLIVLRLLQGVAAALLLPQGLGLLRDVDAGGRAVTGDAKTAAGQNRRVSLGPVAVGALRLWRRTQNVDKTGWAGSWSGDDWVFTREDGKPLLPQFVTKRFESLVQRAELPAMTFHGLRHQHASLLIAQGVDLAVVSKRLGHSSIAIADDLYAHLLRDADLRAAEAAEALVQGASAAVSSSGAHTSHTHGPNRSKTHEAPAEEFLF